MEQFEVALEDTLKYIKLYTQCSEHTLKRISHIIEKNFKDREKIVYIKNVEKVFIKQRKPLVDIQTWADNYFKENKIEYLTVAVENRITDAVRIRRNFCVAAYAEGYKYKEIGKYINRDHTTIMNLVKN